MPSVMTTHSRQSTNLKKERAISRVKEEFERQMSRAERMASNESGKKSQNTTPTSVKSRRTKIIKIIKRRKPKGHIDSMYKE